MKRIKYTDQNRSRLIADEETIGNVLIEDQRYVDGKFLVFAEPTDDLRSEREKWIDACPGFADLDDFKNWLRKEPP